MFHAKDQRLLISWLFLEQCFTNSFLFDVIIMTEKNYIILLCEGVPKKIPIKIDIFQKNLSCLKSPLCNKKIYFARTQF
jgi:hypothetical protein